MEPPVSPPSEIRRALWVYAVLACFVLLAGPSSLLSSGWWQQLEGRDLVELALSALCGALLGLLFSRDIWNLVVRRNPLWKDLLSAALAILAFVGLVLLREFGIWLWSFASGDTLVVSLLATMAGVTLLTERRKRVRVYAYARHFTFVHQPADA